MPEPVSIDVIRPIEIPSSPELLQQAQPTPAPAAPAPGKDFASMHAAALARETTAVPAAAKATGGTAAPTGGTSAPNGGAAAPNGGAPASTGGTSAPTGGTPAPTSAASTSGASGASGKSPHPAERVVAPDGETWAATKPGSHYARIITGPRTGEYINLSRGDRRGQTFTIEERGGRTFHVYGEGDTRVEVSASKDARDGQRSSHRIHGADQPKAGERWAPVEGHSTYADILDGKRNGAYVNTSGGIRDGMAFQIVKKGNKWFHVYGTGKDRQWIPVRPKDDVQSPGTNAAGSTNATPSSSGVGSENPGGSTATAASAGTGGTQAPSSGSDDE